MKKTLFTLLILFPFLIIGCSDDDDDITPPAPSEVIGNEIKITANITDISDTVSFNIYGRHPMIHWGDGDSTIVASTIYKHAYKEKGNYQITIKTDMLDDLTISGKDQPLSNLQVGNCPQLKELYILDFESLTSFSSKNCPQLTTLYIESSKNLAELDVSSSLDLGVLYLGGIDHLHSIDLTKNKNIRWVYGYNIGLENIDLSNCTELYKLEIPYNKLKKLSLYNNTKLEILECQNNELTSLDLTSAERIWEIDCSYNKLTSLKVDKNPYILDCSNNNLTKLELSSTSLHRFYCSNNQISELKIKHPEQLRVILLNSNKLNTGALNSIIEGLDINPDKDSHNRSFYSIRLSDNPGTESCNQQAILDKQWQIF
ncbi:MAG: hypothetical protein E6772_08000 [Dysgonomonas sp.]|nr:hypothetical protein [Dysgonomonas sp.]